MDFLNLFSKSLQDKGERDCFDKYLSPHVPMIYKSAIRMCGNPNNAQDLVQETLYSALKNFHQIHDPEKSKYWMFSILRNLFLKDIEKTKKRAEVEFDAVCEKLSDNDCFLYISINPQISLIFPKRRKKQNQYREQFKPTKKHSETQT